MKKLFLGICFSLLTGLLYAQSLSGTVTDARTGQPLSGATIELLNQGTQLSNEQGQFRFSRIKAGNYTLRISYAGYRSISTAVTAGQATTSYALEPLNLMMQPVEVRATRAADRAPFAKTNIGRKEIEQNNLGQDLPFLLNQTPSVVVNADAGNGVGYTGIRIRGTDATRINMTINGIPYNDAESQGLFFVNLPDLASSVSSVQVQRGVGTSTNGAGAFGATMNFSTNEVLTSPYGEINNSFGSFNTRKHTVKAGSGLLSDHFTIDARLSGIFSDGYIDRASSDLRSFYLSGAWLSEKSSLRLNIISGKEKTYQAWYGVSEADLKTNRRVNYAGTEKPGNPYDNETDNYRQDHYQLFFNHAFNSAWVFNTALYLTEGKGYYEQYKADEPFSKYGLPDFTAGNSTISSTDLIRQLWLDNTLAGQVLSLQYKSGGTQFTIGGGWNRYRGRHNGEIIWAAVGVPEGYRWYNHKALKTDINTYAKIQQQLKGGLSLFGDLQLRNVNYTIDGFRDNPTIKVDEQYHFFNPKLGLNYTRKQYNFYLSYALAQKEPNRDDFEAGASQKPRPEQLHDVEAGVEYRTAKGGWTAGAYYMYYRDQLVLTGKVNDVGAYTRVNIPVSYRLGLELQGYLQATQWFRLSGNLTLSRNKIRSFTEFQDDYDNGGQKTVDHRDADIAFSPSVTGQFSLEFKPLPQLQLNLNNKYVGRQFMDNTSNKSRSLDPFFVQDLQASYIIPQRIFRELRLQFQINNLLNTLYEPNGYTFSYWYGGSLTTENYYYPMAGRNVMGGVMIKL